MASSQYVIKVKYGNSLRRLTIQQNSHDGDFYDYAKFSFAKIESRIRELLKVPASAKLELTYTDSESDVVIMSTDQDVQDALVNQKLNPLRVTATLVEDKPSPPPTTATPAAREEEKDATPSAKVEEKPTSGSIDIEVPLMQVLGRLSSTSDSVVKKIVQAYEPLFEKVSIPAQATGLAENLIRTISAQVATAVKHGADAATSAAAAAAAGASATPAFGFGSGSSRGPAASPAPSSAAPGTASSPSSGSETTSSRSSDAFTAAVVAAAAEVEAAADALKRTNESGSVVHHGVTCDICDVNPVVGVRWKSTKKNNYDLCSSCFEKHGKEADFTKLEQSVFRPRRFHSHGPGPYFPHRPMGNPFGASNPGHFHGGKPFGGRCGFGARHHGPPMMGYGSGKLDARFVCDVTMFDGTEVAPGTRFTKIWRLRNSGTIPWPMRTNLVHVGGDALSEAAMSPMEIPPEGLPAEGEMEAAVDMVAPEKPGRYVSHWRLASPAGPKFGHRIWAVIQVVSKGNEEEDGQIEGGEVVDVNESISGDQVTVVEAENEKVVTVVEAENEKIVTEPKLNQLESTMSFVNVEVPSGEAAVSPADAAPEPQTRELEQTEEDNSTPAGETDLSEGYSMVDAPEESVKFVKEEIVEDQTPTSKVAVEEVPREEEAVTQEVTPAEEGLIAYPTIEETKFDEGPISYPVIQPESAAAAGNLDVLQKSAATDVQPAEGSNVTALMAKLETMGFTNSKLNGELLEKNGLDLRQTLNDLCAVEEWDPILEELEEMGFYDVDVNRRLMFKNNGSVKRVVKELVTMYREGGKGKEKAVE